MASTGTRTPGRQRETIAITADITLDAWDMGKTFHTTGASGAVTVTLPNPAGLPVGSDLLILNVADQNLTISCNELVIAKNNAAADSVAASTAGELIGAAYWCIALPTKWFICHLTEETVTTTVATD
jgi:hypothetical protein